MKNAMTIQDKIGALLRTNKIAILLELILVFLPVYLGVIISDRIGSNHISLGGNVVLLQGPFVYLGMIITLVCLWIVSQLRGASWSDFGVTRPKSWFRTVLMSFGVAIAILGTVTMIINPIINAFPNVEPRDMRMYTDYLRGNLPNLFIQLVNVWITAGFLEEFLWRGYLMPRLIDLQGKQTKLSWGIALVVSAVIFGLIHLFQGPIGIFKVGAIGLVFGLSYLAVGRNLWPLVFAHALIDTLDMVSHYFGG